MESIIQAISSGSVVGLFLKLFGVVIGFLYLFYALVIVRQVGLMKTVVTIHDGGVLKILAFLQVLLALAIVIFALFL
jgi:Family of unknown function (DUF5657)